ncbi:MAG: DNA polymerase III subunit delta [Ruminococcaceae bacterium]|nr:DNA polymerase III subunit delta [Oscillospiraceae bacterium]
MAKSTDKDYKFMKAALDSGEIGKFYIFSGEESYLRQFCVNRLHKQLVEGVCEAFNYHDFNGSSLDLEALSLAIDTYPMMSDRSMVLVNDFDIFGMNESNRTRFIEIIEDLPDYVCLIFVYDTITYKADGRQKKLTSAIDKYGICISFDPQPASELTAWTVKKFKSLGRDISRGDASYLVDISDGLMTSLNQEIEKLAAFTKGEVNRSHIDELVEPTVEAVVFDMTNAIAEKRFGDALNKLHTLCEKKEEPISLLSVLGGQLRQLYTAKLALDAGKDAQYLQKLWGLSPYATKLRINASKRFTVQWCQKALKLCAETDLKMKSTGYDKQLQLEMLILELAGK